MRFQTYPDWRGRATSLSHEVQINSIGTKLTFLHEITATA